MEPFVVFVLFKYVLGNTCKYYENNINKMNHYLFEFCILLTLDMFSLKRVFLSNVEFYFFGFALIFITQKHL